ncbi:hypothetical protein GGR54DRAFT_376511 [Hypoxylon sp. NC1633]|nr:hypothetical protein GGR54DRAFT_376511 [Hypoxylon sp. NC1633]
MTVTADDIAELVQKQFDALPAKRKPVVRANGLREWVPLAGIVAQGRDGKLQCLALATGMKCLPASKLPKAQGNVLHDWHAEVLAIRAFNRFVLDECDAMVKRRSSEFLRWRTPGEIAAHTSSSAQRKGEKEKGEEGEEKTWHGQPFTWREDILLHMYCSEAPCGDASMELIMAAQEDATPWDMPPISASVIPAPSSSSNTGIADSLPTLPGRAYFSHLGLIRRKPSRPDAPPTLSKSCSDKLALRQCVSLLNSPAAMLIDPSHVYLRTLVLPASRYSEVACRRAFSADRDGEGRMAGVTALMDREGKGKGGYAFHPFTVQTTTSEFAFSQRSVSLPLPPSSYPDSSPSTPTACPSYSHATYQQHPNPPSKSLAPSNVTTLWTLTGRQETTLGGTLQGRKQFDVRGGSCASRRELWRLAARVADLLPVEDTAGRNVEDGDGDGVEGRASGVGDVRVGAREEHQGESEAGRQEEEQGEGDTASKEQIQTALHAPTYGMMKDSVLLGPRRRIKEQARAEALRGWVRNLGDEDFGL